MSFKDELCPAAENAMIERASRLSALSRDFWGHLASWDRYSFRNGGRGILRHSCLQYLPVLCYVPVRHADGGKMWLIERNSKACIPGESTMGRHRIERGWCITMSLLLQDRSAYVVNT